MRYHSYLNTAKRIIASYTGGIPLSVYLKQFFSGDKKYGSRDRKQISTLCYHYYRTGKAVPDMTIEEKILAGTLLCETTYNDLLQYLKPDWNAVITKPLLEKIAFLHFPVEDIFPLKDELSDGIGQDEYCLSFLQQPDLFVRIRPGKKDIVLKELQDAGMNFKQTGMDCIALPNSSKLESIIDLDTTVVVQDMNSQKVLDHVKEIPGIAQSMNAPGVPARYPLSIWDCCAASGGKSILAYDLFAGRVELTVSDVRESILANLKKRFAAAGIERYEAFVADLLLPGSITQPPGSDYRLIICDAPCTGSGTWSRTPEQLFYFKPEQIGEYAAKQKKIVSTVIPRLAKDGIFVYITCSVFKAENEHIVEFIKNEFRLQLIWLETLKGYDQKADTMFTAVFKQ